MSHRRKKRHEKKLRNEIYFFICGLFKKTVSNSDYVASGDWMIMNWKRHGSDHVLI
jgi:hypothetical protein